MKRVYVVITFDKKYKKKIEEGIEIVSVFKSFKEAKRKLDDDKDSYKYIDGVIWEVPLNR